MAFTISPNKTSKCMRVCAKMLWHVIHLYLRLLYIQFECLKSNIFILSFLIGTKPYLNVVMSTCWQLLHKPRRAVEGTASIESTTALAIPERIVGKECICIIIVLQQYRRNSHFQHKEGFVWLYGCGY